MAPKTPKARFLKHLWSIFALFWWRKYQKKGEHFILFFKHFWRENRRHSTKKTSIPSCFLNIFGRKIGGTVQKKRRAKKASIPSCFLNMFGRNIGGTVPKKSEHSVLFFKHVWGHTWRHSTQLKKASICSCFVFCILWWENRWQKQTALPNAWKKRYVVLSSFHTLSSRDRNAIQPRRKERSSAQHNKFFKPGKNPYDCKSYLGN